MPKAPIQTPILSTHEAARAAYEEDCRHRPNYPDGQKRRTWNELSEYAKLTWREEARIISRRNVPAHSTQQVEIDLRTAQIIRSVFLPANPNKLRKAAPEVVSAAKNFIAAVNQTPSGIPTFTAWCQEKSGEGTIWVGSFEAEDLEAAKAGAIERCAEDWHPFEAENIHLLGIAAGDVEILHWQDVCDT